MVLAYRRALLKISGEALAGPRGVGLDYMVVESLAQQIKEVHAQGIHLGLVVGGGNLVRGAAASTEGLLKRSSRAGRITRSSAPSARRQSQSTSYRRSASSFAVQGSRKSATNAVPSRLAMASPASRTVQGGAEAITAANGTRRPRATPAATAFGRQPWCRSG